MKPIIPLLLAVAVLSARADVLVYEGFHPADYNNVGDNTQMTPSGANVTGDHTVGLATGAWSMNGSMPKVYGANFGLALPPEMTAAGFSALGGSIGLNPGDDNKALRSTSHGLVAGTLNVSSGTLYVRALLNLDSKAATKLVAGDVLAQKDGGYFGFGLTTGTTDYYLLTRSAASIAFVVWKNASNQYVLSLAHTTASGTAFTSYPLVTGVTLGTTYLCYAEIQVGAGAGGKEVLRAGAMASDAFTTDTPWAMIGGESDTVEVELMTDASYPTCIALAGPYGTKDGSNGYFRADEFVVGTELSDILLGSTTKPKLSDGSLALANGVYTATAALSQSDAYVTYTLSDGDDATPEAPVALGAGSFTADSTATGTFAAPADDTTYEVILTAMNAGDETAELSLGTIYGGSLSLGAATDANETGLVAGGVTVSRAAADPLPLTVNYTISGSAGSEGATWAAPVAVTIPAGSASAVLPVTPVSDPDVTEDVTITVSLAAGNYGLPSANAATLTLVNHRAAVPADFAKKITLTPSETALAKIGETAWTDFPVLVRLPAEASAQLQSANGTDLYVTDENDSALPFEVDTFDPAGETLVWVKVPSLTASTELTAFFGGAANIDNDPTAVWSGYVGVWHMDEASGSVADATGHGLTASVMGNSANSVAVAGAVGNGRQTATAAAKGYLSVPNYDRFGLGSTFTMSGWVKMSACTAYPRVFSRKANYTDANGWEMEMNNGSMATFGARGINNSPGYSGTFSPSLQNAWSHLVLVYDGATLTVYQNGAQVKTGAITAATDNGLALSFGCDSDGSETYLQGAFDECRLMDGTATADGVALDWLAQSAPAFFDLGAIESVDTTAQVFETPTIVRNANGTYTVTVVLSENSGDVGVVYDASATAVTNLLATAAAPGTFTDTPANLTADTTYAFAAYGRNANGTEVVKEGGVFYNGELTVEKISDAAENGLVPGVFRISRADTAHDLVVSYTVGGTATAGQTYAALSGTATIPSGSTHVDVEVVPLLDSATTENTTVSLVLAAGLYGVDAQAGSAEMTVENLVVPAGFNTWVAAADGLASVGSNWSEGHAPLASENVLFDGRFSSANCEWDAAATATVASWTQTNGYSGVVTLDTVYPGKGVFTCLTVTGAMAIRSGTITHPQSRTQAESAADCLQDLLDNETYRVRIDAGSLTVDTNGRIDARNKGYYHSNSGSHTSPLPSHGGWFGASGQAPYDDVKEPVHIGMPYKRASGNYYVGIGGGAIYLTSAGAVVVDGYIGADTGSDTWNRNLTLRCGGAAGSVYVRGATVSGSGTISASALKTDEQNYRGVGGRVAVIATSSTPIDCSTLHLKASVYPYNNNNGQSTTYGSSGTVFVKDASQTYGTLLLDNADGAFAPSVARCTPVTADGDWTFDALGLGNYAVLSVPVGTALHLPSGLDSVFSLGAANSTAYGSIRHEGGTLDLGASTDQTMAGSWMLTGWTNLVLDADVTVKDGAAIGVPAMAVVYDTSTTGVLPDFVSCDVTVNGDLTVESTGGILAKSCGMRKNRSDQHNGVLGFHSHGGRSLRWGRAADQFYEAYDSVFSPGLPGCTVPFPDGQTAGAAGGAVRLTVSGTLTLDGPANASGLPEAYNQGGNASGGAGGAIDITAGRLAGAGSITANGGCYLWQRGPGGRIAVKLTSTGADFANFSGTIKASGRARNDNYKGSGDASAGTVYLQTGAEGDKSGTICIGQSLAESYYGTDGVSGNTNTTEMVSLGYGGDDVRDYRRVKYVVRDYGRAAVNVDMQAASIEISDANSFLDLEGHLLVVTSARVAGRNVPSGTYTAAQLASLGFSQVVDTADGAGGTLVVHGRGTVFIVK